MDDRKKSIDTKIQSLIERSSDFQDKFTYYILAVDAACIGFSINYNKDATFSWLLLIFSIAISFWLLSFHFGIKELRITDVILIENHKFLVAQRTQNEKAINGHYEALGDLNERVIKAGKYKVLFLYFGVIMFLVWYFLKIYINHNI